MATVKETTIQPTPPPRTFTVELREAQLVALAEWSYTTEAFHSNGGSVFSACPVDIREQARSNVNRRTSVNQARTRV